jgi:predicted GTPase
LRTLRGCQPPAKRGGLTVTLKRNKQNNMEKKISILDISKCRDYVKEDSPEDALKHLFGMDIEDTVQDNLYVLMGMYKSLQKDKISDIISYDEYNIRSNKIRSSLLGIIRELEKNYYYQENEKINKSNSIKEKISNTSNDKKLKVFVSYSHQDEPYRNELEVCLSMLKRQKIIDVWSDRQILAGSSWEKEIDSNIESADIFIFLISADFIASDYCYEIEMTRALERHDKAEAIVVPIIIRPCAWKNSPFANFQVLPIEGHPILSSFWNNRDEAWQIVYEGIYNLCNSLTATEGSNNDFKTYQNKQNIKGKKSFSMGVFGETGAGKSTICNAIFGKEIMRVSDITPVTRTPVTIKLETDEFEIVLTDCPGIGESVEEDARIAKLYEPFFEKVDFILWVLRSDVRNYSCDQEFINKIQNMDMQGEKKFLIALNMVDKLSQSNEWNLDENCPPLNQLMLIERKIMYVSGLFRVSPLKIIPISGLKGYNVSKLLENILTSVFPEEKHSIQFR